MSGKVLLLGSVFAISTIVFAGRVSAWEMSQSQSSSVEVHTECSGGECKAKATSSVSQDQRQHTWSSERSWRSDKPGHHWGWDDEWMRDNEGEVRLSWNLKEGTCHVRYGENRGVGFPHTASANCDEGGITIGGLERGRLYKFQIKQDDGSWSTVKRRMAW